MGKELKKPRHIGDGVYIHDNGFGIALAVNHHENIVIHMEPWIIEAFVQYCKESGNLKK